MDQKKRHFFENRMHDLAIRGQKSGIPAYTDFLTTDEYSCLKQLAKEFYGISLRFWGGHKDCDHVMGAFVPTEYEEFMNAAQFPICCLKITPVGIKFSQQLQHRDYLGAILNLGMERSKIGDIRICDKQAYVFCHLDFAPFLLDELRAIKHTTVQVSLVTEEEEIPPQEYELLMRSVASLRLDNIITAAIGCSRSKASELIAQGNVVADHMEQHSSSYTCKDQMVFTIRGYGKYRLSAEDESYTKKGKRKIIIYKYK